MNPPGTDPPTYLRFWLVVLLAAMFVAGGLSQIAAGSENLLLGVVAVMGIPYLALIGLLALVMIAVDLAKMSLAAVRRRRSH